MKKEKESAWKCAKTDKPKIDILAIVCNDKGWMYEVTALYCQNNDVWKLHDPNYRTTLLLDVTHYIEIPRAPRRN